MWWKEKVNIHWKFMSFFEIPFLSLCQFTFYFLFDASYLCHTISSFLAPMMNGVFQNKLGCNVVIEYHVTHRDI